MLTPKKESEIRKLLENKMSEENIAERLGISRYHVRLIKKRINQAVATAKPDKNLSPKVSAHHQLEPYREQIIEWLDEKRLSIFLIHKKLLDLHLSLSISSVQRYINQFKKPEVYVPVHTAQGEEAQVDYGYLGKFNREGKLVKVWVFNMVLSYSRYAFYSIVTEQTAASFIGAHQLAFEYFGGSPQKILIDNLGAGVLEYDFYQTQFQELYLSFLDHYGVTATNCRISRGSDKGKVEAGIKFVKRNWLPAISHNCYEQLVIDLKTWNNEKCNKRIHGTTRKIPEIVFLKEEKQQLYTLPRERFRLTTREPRTVDPYGHVYFRYNFYSVPAHYSGEELILHIGEKTFEVFKGAILITTHVIHPGTGQFITMNCHKPYHKQAKTDLHYREEVQKIGESAARVYELLRVTKPYHWKNMIKGILRLKEVYSCRMIDKACLQAMEAGIHEYKDIRRICLSQSTRRKIPGPFKTPKNTGGYYHDLSIYEKLVNKTI